MFSSELEPGFFFIETQKPLSEAQNDSTIAFSYDPSISYTIDSVSRNKPDHILYKIVIPDGVNLSDNHDNIVGFTMITT